MALEIKLERYDVQALGRKFQFTGKLEPVGQLLDYLNTATRTTFPMYDVTALPISSGSLLKGVTRPEITVSASELGLVYFLDAEYRQRVQVLKSFDSAIAYTPHAVLRGKFHRGAETRLRDLFDMMQGSFLAMTDVSIFPTVDLPAPFVQQADLLIVNRFYIDLYHAE
jgi:hypothetical protein